MCRHFDFQSLIFEFVQTIVVGQAPPYNFSSPHVQNNIRPIGKKQYGGQNPGGRAFRSRQADSYTSGKNDPNSSARKKQRKRRIEQGIIQPGSASLAVQKRQGPPRESTRRTRNAGAPLDKAKLHGPAKMGAHQ
jgi:hypothetical protein